MHSRRRSATRRRGAGGFTLIELLVSMLMAMIATLAITRIAFEAEGQKRAAISGSDAQADGATAIASIRRVLLSAGYGYTQVPDAIGCPIAALYNGAPIPGFPAALVPVLIVDGGVGGAPDSIRMIASAKPAYSVPTRLAEPYAPTQTEFTVASPLGVQPRSGTVPGDLMLAASDAAQPCGLFEVTDIAGTKVGRADDATGWNAPGHPAQSYSDDSSLINLGSMSDTRFSIEQGALAVTTLRLDSGGAPSYVGPVELQPDVVNLQALYGKDTDGDGVVDGWDAETPATGDAWLTVAAVRIAVVARSRQYEKEEVTPVNPQWDVGTAVPVAGSATCGTSNCLPLKVDHLTDFKHYRYKVFDSVVPLRNMVWRPV